MDWEPAENELDEQEEEKEEEEEEEPIDIGEWGGVWHSSALNQHPHTVDIYSLCLLTCAHSDVSCRGAGPNPFLKLAPDQDVARREQVKQQLSSNSQDRARR